METVAATRGLTIVRCVGTLMTEGASQLGFLPSSAIQRIAPGAAGLLRRASLKAVTAGQAAAAETNAFPLVIDQARVRSLVLREQLVSQAFPRFEGNARRALPGRLPLRLQPKTTAAGSQTVKS